MISWIQNKIAAQYSKIIPKDKIIAIGGSFDQQITALAAKKVLLNIGEVVSTTDFLTDESAIAKTLLKLGSKTKSGIFELKPKNLNDTENLLKLISPQVAVIVGIDLTHSETFGSLEQIKDQSFKLLSRLPTTGAAILNWDDLNCRKLAENTEAEVIFFGTDPKNCHLWAGNFALNKLNLSFELNYGVERVEINTPFIGQHQVYPLLAAATLGLREDLRLTQIKKSLEAISPLEGQLQVAAGFSGSIILSACQTDSPTLVEQAIETLNSLPARRRILVFGEIKRLGSFWEKLHKQFANKIYKDKLDLVLVAKGEAKLLADELLKLGFISERLEEELTNPQIVSSLLKILAKGDVVLVVGSKELRLDEVVAKITRK